MRRRHEDQTLEGPRHASRFQMFRQLRGKALHFRFLGAGLPLDCGTLALGIALLGAPGAIRDEIPFMLAAVGMDPMMDELQTLATTCIEEEARLGGVAYQYPSAGHVSAPSRDVSILDVLPILLHHALRESESQATRSLPIIVALRTDFRPLPITARRLLSCNDGWLAWMGVIFPQRDAPSTRDSDHIHIPLRRGVMMATIPSRFASREAAAELLARNLAPYNGRHPLVLAIPRGALPMGRIIANALHGDLDVVLVRKIGAPGNPEYAIGAVDEEGQIWTDPLAGRLGIDGRYMRDEAARQLKVIKTRRAQYTPIHPALDPRGRIVIVVDDGVATGATLGAALRLLRQRRPARLIAAFAVAPPDTITRLQPLADDLVYLSAPEPFHAVGEFFTDFREVKDEEVLRILREISPPRQESEHP